MDFDQRSTDCYGFVRMKPSEPLEDDFDTLSYIPSPNCSQLAAIDTAGRMCELWQGVRGQPLHVIETPSKSTSVFSIRSMPDLFVVSYIGGTVVLEIKNEVVSELEQSQTRISLSDGTVYCGDANNGICVQATRSWVNFFSKTGNAVYKCSHAERIFACSSQLGSGQVLIALGDGELRGRGRVILLGISDQGEVVETARKDLLQEVIDVEHVPGVGNVVITTDHSMLLLSANELALKSHLKFNSPLKSVMSICRSGSFLVGTMTGLLSRVEIDNDALKIVLTQIISSEPVNLIPSVIEGKGLALTQNRSFLVDSYGNVSRLHIGTGSVVSAAFLGDQWSLVCAVTGQGVVELSRLTNYEEKISDEKIEYFSSKFFASIPRGTIIDTVSYGSSQLVLIIKDSPPIILSSSGKAKELTSLGRVGTACTVDVGKMLLLTYSLECGYSLLNLKHDDACELVWMKPEIDIIESVGQIPSRDLFISVSSSGIVRVFSLSADSVPHLILENTYDFPGPNKLLFWKDNPNRIVLVNAFRGIFCLAYSTDKKMIVTAVTYNRPREQPAITASALLDQDTVVAAEAGNIAVYKIPESVSHDETSPIAFAALTFPDLCMATVDLAASLEISDSYSVSSLLRCSHIDRSIVYFACGKTVGAVVPSRNDGFALKSNWAWS